MRAARKSYRLAEKLIVTHWWTWLVCLNCLFLYELQAKKANKETIDLQDKALLLSSNIQKLTKEKQALDLQIASFNDPRFGEICLREELGMKRHSQIKVVFK